MILPSSSSSSSPSQHNSKASIDKRQRQTPSTRTGSDSASPPYRAEEGDVYLNSTCTIAGEGLDSSAIVREDGRIDVEMEFKKALPSLPDLRPTASVDLYRLNPYERQIPRMNIIIMIVGSRGDVQPYIALGNRLLKDGHRIRLATHGTFGTFVKEHGLEFFDIGGNPHDLMSYMVKNPGLIPGRESFTNGDIKRKRKMLLEIMRGCWAACCSPCPSTGRNFVADAIISNPPAFAHIHCAEAMQIPLLMSFTMPWTPTSAFPHPLVNIKRSNAEKRMTNYLSYHLAELLTWQGLGDLINDFRMIKLGLEPLTVKSGPGILDTLQVPWTYCISPSLVPKPSDWGQHIDVSGFYFLESAVDYRPSASLAEFLAAGPPPIYVGFGSIVVDDPIGVTTTIFEATRQAGVRALVSAGWGGLGGIAIPPHVFVLGNMPHDWLFADGRVAAVVHHGGAGTTAAGLAKGLPTVIVPFFGDQGFWGNMVERAGAGPTPLSPKALNVDTLKSAIEFAMTPSAQAAAKKLADQIQKEDGVNRGAISFYRHMPMDTLRCELDPSRATVWWSKKYCLRLSCFAAQVLAESGQLRMEDLKPYIMYNLDTDCQAIEPVSGIAGAIFWMITEYSSVAAELFYSPLSGIRRTVTALPETAIRLLNGLSDGFQNVPKLYGAHTRKHKKITGIRSGLKEGGKAFAYGLYDGAADLVMEPVRGSQKEGVVGVLKGAGRGVANAAFRPIAGCAGVVAHPLQGAWAKLKLDAARKNEVHRLALRVQEGEEEVAASTQDERLRIIREFGSSLLSLEKRREGHRNGKQEGKPVILDVKGKGRALADDSESTNGRRRYNLWPTAMRHRTSSSAGSLGTADVP